MKKTLNNLFSIGLVTWFTSSIYLSLNSLVNLFISTDPYIAKCISGFSLIWVAVIGLYNHYKGEKIASLKMTSESILNNVKNKPEGGCKSCKQKQKQ